METAPVGCNPSVEATSPVEVGNLNRDAGRREHEMAFGQSRHRNCLAIVATGITRDLTTIHTHDEVVLD